MRKMVYSLMCKWFGFRVVVYWGFDTYTHYGMSVEEITKWARCYPSYAVCMAYAGNKLIGRI